MRANAILNSKSLALTKTTLFLVLGAETALFGTLVMSYLFMRSGGSDLSFVHPRPFDLMLASLNTLVLLISAVLAGNAHRAIGRDRANLLKIHLLTTLILGSVFLAGQVFEFIHSGMRIDDSTFGGVFFALIGFHALHVVAGITVIALNFVRSLFGDFSVRHHTAITVGTWFWYYVVAVWIVLFTVLYLV
jgi:cytochrome c oxidase subunit III